MDATAAADSARALTTVFDMFDMSTVTLVTMLHSFVESATSAAASDGRPPAEW